MGMGKKVLQKASHTPLSFFPGQEKIFLCPGKNFSLGIYQCFSNKKNSQQILQNLLTVLFVILRQSTKPN